MTREADSTNFDVIIIGGGPAGLSAALWCDDLGLSALLLEKSVELGGQLLWTHNSIKNHLGRDAENGLQLRDIFLKQLADRRFQTFLNARVATIDFENKRVLLTDERVFSARSIILATGIRRRKLSIAGEDDFKGRGVIESGKQNSATVQNKRVLIVGGGDAAFENALILGENAALVTLIHRRSKFTARAEFVEKAAAHPKVTILTETVPEKILGNERLEAIEIRHLPSGAKSILPIETLLIRIGVEPNTELGSGKILLDKNGYIIVDATGRTNLPAVFAVGDVANPLSPTVSSAIGTGATTVKAIYSWLNP